MPEGALVEHERSGLLFHGGDSEALAGAIFRMLAEGGLQSRLSENAYRIIREKYNLDRMAQGFFDAAEYCVSLERNWI